MSFFPQTLAVGNKGALTRVSISTLPEHLLRDIREDPRGLAWMWEPKRSGELYFMGIDPTVGRTGWTREGRTEDDSKTDNGAIEIIRKGRNGQPDVQVCEYAAPVDAFDLGYIANVLGRIYGQPDEDHQCKCIIESYPGPGAGTLQTLLQLGYTNLWKWEYFADTVATPTKSIGWQATARNNQSLWAKGSRLMNLRRTIVKSPWLTEECADLEVIPGKGWAEASYGAHDDRVRAFLLALWAANGWSLDVETTAEPVRRDVAQVDWQCTDMDMDEIMADWANVLDRMEYMR